MIETILKIKEQYLSQRPYTGPFYAMDAALIETRATEFKKSFSLFPHVRFLYSYKTNSLKDAAHKMKSLGYGAEVVSGDELECALSDGHMGKDIFFDGPVKNESELRLAVKNGVTIQLDSFFEWEEIKRLFPNQLKEIKLGVRLSHIYEKTQFSRFGFTADEFHDIYEDIYKSGAVVSGVHLHVGSNLTHIENYLIEFDRYIEIIKKVVHGKTDGMPWIDLGGGFPALSNREGKALPDLTQWCLRLLTHMTSKGLNPSAFTLVFEPGRNLVEDAGYLFCQAATLKYRSSENILVLDTGLNHVRSFHSWQHRIFPLQHKTSGVEKIFKVYGANCFESDLFHLGLPVNDAKPGDWFVITNVGGYDIPSVNPWIRKHPAIYFFENNELRMSRPSSTELSTRVSL
jgi:diaminopimelate decarboxylase